MTSSAVSDTELEQWMEGEVTLGRAAEIEAALVEDLQLKKRHEQLLEMHGHLRATEGWMTQLDLVAGVMKAVHTSGASTQRRGMARTAWTVAGMLSAALVLVFVWVNPWPAVEPGVRVKGAALQEDAWVGVDAFRVDGNGKAQRLGPVMSRSDPLAFSYTNLARPPWSFVLVFGVDARGQVHWYHPEYSSSGAPPSAVPAQPGSQVELPDMVTHDLPPGLMTLTAVFSQQPISVQAVEERVARMLKEGAWQGPHGPLLFPATTQRQLAVEVQ